MSFSIPYGDLHHGNAETVITGHRFDLKGLSPLYIVCISLCDIIAGKDDFLLHLTVDNKLYTELHISCFTYQCRICAIHSKLDRAVYIISV